MSSKKMKPGTAAALASWTLVCIPAVFLLFLYFQAWDVNASYAWATLPVFRVRIIAWVLLSLGALGLGCVGCTRMVAQKMGTGTDEFKKKNLLLRSRN